jgi:hypothetical protein
MGEEMKMTEIELGGNGLHPPDAMGKHSLLDREKEKKEKDIDVTEGYLLRQLKYFCGDTSLHGCQYIHRFAEGGKLGWLHRLLWTILVLFALVFAGYNVETMYREYSEQTPVISIGDTTGPLDEVYFPSVTVCNLNQFRMSQANRMGLDMTTPSGSNQARWFTNTYLASGSDFDYEQEIKAANKSDKKNWDKELADMQNNLAKAGINWDPAKENFISVNGTAQDCSDLMLHTKWNSIDKYGYSSHVTYTDFGYCCRIYPILELEEPSMLQHSKWSGEWLRPEYRDKKKFRAEYEARRGSKNGIGNGLLLMMDVETFEDAHYPRKADGLIVALSGNLERPLVGQSGTFLEPGSANLITFEVVGTNTTHKALIKYRPDIKGNSEGGSRTCYVDNNDRLEFDPKYFDNANYFKFSMSNCLYSSMVTAIESRCNCTPTYSRREVKHTWSGPPPVSCVGDKMKCMENLTRAWGSNEHGLNMAEDQQGALGELPKLCHENCDSQELRVATSRSGYPKKRTLPLTEDFCLIVAKMRKICKDKNRAKAFEDHYVYETPLTGGDGHLRCAIVEDQHVEKHCQLLQGQKTLYNPVSEKGTAARKAEDLLEKAVARYAEDNMLVVRVFLKDPYYQKMVRDRKMSGGSFFGSAGGFLGLCLGLSAMSVVEIFYHVFLFIIAICRGREMSETYYKNEK